MSRKKPIVAITAVTIILGIGVAVLLLQVWFNQARVPSDSESADIVKETTLSFASAVQAKDLSKFRITTAPEFKEKFSTEDFDQAFGGFIEQEINLFPVAKLEPVFSMPPALTDDGTLLLKGYFPTRPSQVHFEYSYIWRDRRWQIVGINLDVVPASGG